MSNLKVLASHEFPSAIASGAVLVDFGAPWCGPCKALEPLLVQLGEELAGKLAVVKVDIEATPELAEDLGVMSVPTLMVFKDGRKIAGCSGALSLEKLRTLVAPAL
jgi:thioredoxin 1